MGSINSRLLLMVSLLLLGASVSAYGENWPQWRGPRGDGISLEQGIATEWSSTEHIAWRAPLPGQGGATPIVWGDRLFVTSAAGDDLVLLALSTKDGRQLWARKVSTGNQQARVDEGNSASPSPSTDGKHVWAFFGTGTLACYDVDGKPVWKTDVNERFGEIDIQFGMTSTPVLHEDSLYLQLIHGPMVRGNDFRTGKVVRLNKLTGKTIWAVDRVTDAEYECKHSYASPFLYEDGERRFLVVHGADCTTGHDLEDGHELWRFGELNGPSQYNQTEFDATFRFIASPGVVPGAIIIPTAKQGPSLALRITDALRGNVSAKAEVVRWTNPTTPDVSIPLVVDGLVYQLHKDGKLQCIDLESGEEMYFVRTHTSQHRASPVYADGHIYLCAKDGRCTVIKAGPKFEIVASNDLGEPIAASPVVAGGVLYLRSYNALYAIR